MAAAVPFDVHPAGNDLRGCREFLYRWLFTRRVTEALAEMCPSPTVRPIRPTQAIIQLPDLGLFERLQAEQPDVYPDGQLRTLQRRLKDWRREVAHKMVFGAEAAGATPGPAPLSSNVWPGLHALVS